MIIRAGWLKVIIIVFRPTTEFFTYTKTSLLPEAANLTLVATERATPTVTRSSRL